MVEDYETLKKEIEELRLLSKSLIEKIDKLTEVVKAAVDVNDSLREVIEKSFKEVKKEDVPEPPVDMTTDEEAKEEIVDEQKKAEAERSEGGEEPKPSEDADEHEDVTEEVVKASTPEPPGEYVDEDPIIKFLKGELSINDLDRIFG